MMSRLIRAISENGGVLFCAVDSTDIVREAERIHKTSAVTSAALGRLLTAASMMGVMLKSEKDSLTLRIKGGGPSGTVLAVSDGAGNVRGYVEQPVVELPPRADGKLDVGGAVGRDGTLSVVKDLGMKEPYVGQTQLVTGEIAEDLTYYFATSEQVPSSVALGVLMNKDNTVRQAGGFIIQLLPGASDEIIDKIEAKLSGISSITALLNAGKTPEEILTDILGEFGLEILSKMPVQFHCDCDRSRVEKAIISIGKKEIQDMINEGREIEVNCQFCNKHYKFSVDELGDMLKKATRE